MNIDISSLINKQKSNYFDQLTVTCGNEVPSLYDNRETSEVISVLATSVTAGADLQISMH